MNGILSVVSSRKMKQSHRDSEFGCDGRVSGGSQNKSSITPVDPFDSRQEKDFAKNENMPVESMLDEPCPREEVPAKGYALEATKRVNTYIHRFSRSAKNRTKKICNKKLSNNRTVQPKQRPCT